MGKYEFSKAILIVYCVIMLYLLVFMLINFIVISNGTAEDYSENIEEAIKNGRETGNIWYTRHRTNANKTKSLPNMCWTSLYANKHKKHKYDLSPPTNNWR